MPKIPTGSTRELAPEGTHNAVCVQVIDLGTQKVRDFKDKEKFNDVRKLNMAFQLVEEETSEGKAVVVYRQYTFSASPKSNLMKDLKAWVGLKIENAADFDTDTLLGKACSITVEHETTEKGTYANISNIAALPKGMKAKKPTEALVSFSLDEGEFDQEVFDALPEYLRLKIADSPEYAAATAPKPSKKVAGKKK